MNDLVNNFCITLRVTGIRKTYIVNHIHARIFQKRLEGDTIMA